MSSAAAVAPACVPPCGGGAPVRLSEFEVLYELGAGSYARVVCARRVATGELFALKVMSKAFLLRERKAAAARRERDILASLRAAGTRGVLRLCFTFQDASSLYLGTELCAGGDLQVQLARRPRGAATEREARCWVAQAACGLAALHAAPHRAVHRDVKPENILLNASGHVRLCDFGSVKLLDAHAQDAAARQAEEDAAALRPRRGRGSFAGTAEYVAPELIDGGEASPAADYWSLGCVLFQCLAGRPPFKGATEYLTYQAVLARQMEHPEECSAAARAAVDALLVVAPHARCGAAHGLDDLRRLTFFADVPWERIWEQTPPEVLPPPPPPRAAAAAAKGHCHDDNDDDDDNEIAHWELGAGAAAAGARPFGVDALRDALRCTADRCAADAPPPPALPAWRLLAGERVVRSCAAARKRGASLQRGRLTLTSAARMALLPERACGGDDGGGGDEACVPLLLLRATCVRALDARHLALRREDDGALGGAADVFVELMGEGLPLDAAQQWADAAAAAVATVAAEAPAAAHEAGGT
jgi:3-phosphoinositide dependent protein kinase-1